MTNILSRRQWIAGTAALLSASFFARALGAEDPGAWFKLPDGGLDSARSIQPAPERLVEGGKILSGVFAAPPREANLLDADLFRGPRAAWRRKRLMEWFGYGIILEDWYLGMIIIDAKLLPISGVYVVNRRDGTTFSYDLMAGRVKVAANPWNDKTWARSRGYDVEFTHNLARGRNGIRFDLARRGRPHMTGELELVEDMEKLPSLSAVVPTQPPYFFYTHKACMPVSGAIEIDGEKIVADPTRHLANLDEHRNYAQTPALWTWGTGAAFDGQGRIVAFNLGDTGGIDQEHWNENCLWIDNRMELMGPVKWSHNRKDPYQPWTVREIHGRAELEFKPQNGKIVKLPPLGKYYQMAGRYNGFVVDSQGERREIKDLYGCAENGAIGK